MFRKFIIFICLGLFISMFVIVVATKEKESAENVSQIPNKTNDLEGDKTVPTPLHPIDKIRQFDRPLTLEKGARRSGSHGSDEAQTLAEALSDHRCLPTAVARGPCHSCVCSDLGFYFCRSEECIVPAHPDVSRPGHPECESNMLYNEDTLWCNCNSRGLWRSSNCKNNFNFINKKMVVRSHLSLPDNYSCEKGAYYAVDCNICECKTGVLSVDSCTNRTCVPTHRHEECELGQVLRNPNEMCTCSAIGTYVDKLCVNFQSKDTIQKLSTEQLGRLTHEVQSAFVEITGDQTRCRPNSELQRDCNKCRCSETGAITCTNKLCLDSQTGKHLRLQMEESKALRTSNKVSDLPELESDKQSCVPGKQYKYKCNSCTCSNKGKPSCTTMICLEEYEDVLRQRSTDTQKPVQTDNNTSVNILRSLPSVEDGEYCVPGKMYRQGCNMCHCLSSSKLLCTKMLCVNAEQGVNRQKHKGKKFLKHAKPGTPKQKRLNLVSEEVKSFESEPSSETEESNTPAKKRNRSVKKARRQGKNYETKSKYKKPLNAGGYPELPNTKCEPGRIYKKGCQRCFCTNRKIAQCTNRPCEEMKDKVKLPQDVHPNVPKKEFENLPQLSHQAAKCDKGTVYRIHCNLCLCLHNGNLLCDKLLCLALDEVNRIAAQKQSKQPCDPDSFLEPDDRPDCVRCRCSRKGKTVCQPVPDCNPSLRRSLHGVLHPRVEPKQAITEDETHCTPGMVYKQNCNNCYCQEDGSLRCTRKGCLNYELVEKLKEQRERLLAQQDRPIPIPEELQKASRDGTF